MKKLVLISLLLSIKCTYAQHEGDTWVFGDSCGIKFDSVPHFFQTSIYSGEANASIADKDGKLLYYAGGYQWSSGLFHIWDTTNTSIPSPTGILGNESSTQGALLLPNPADSNSIILFSFYDDFTYNKINKATNSVDSANILLTDSITEKLCAVRHGNGRDWWVLAHKSFSDAFIKILVTANGISMEPLQHIGYSLNNSDTYTAGQMVLSPQGNKLCFVNCNGAGMIELFDFNRCDGMLSNNIHLGNAYVNTWPITSNYYGTSFSPDGSKLYVSSGDSIFQYNLNAANLILSRTLVARQPTDSIYFGQHLLGPDGKIYITSSSYSDTSIENTSLNVINFPDSLGVQCDVSLYSFSLNGNHSIAGLPNIPNYRLGVDSGSVCDTITGSPPAPIGGASGLQLYPNPVVNQLTISIPISVGIQLAIGQEVTVTIYDILSKFQLQQKITSSTNKINLDVSNLINGIYFLKVKQGDKVYNVKFVK